MKHKLFIIVVGLLMCQISLAQTRLKEGCYLISFTDKQHSPYSLDRPYEFLSERAIDRKSRLGIDITESDLPVSPAYISTLTEFGARIMLKSRWFNSVVVEVDSPDLIKEIMKLDFVDTLAIHYPLNDCFSTLGDIPSVASITEDSVISDETFKDGTPEEIADRMIYEYTNINWLHSNHNLGNKMLIAIIDGGFYHVNKLEAFERLYKRGQIVDTHDFIDYNGNIYREDSHGMKVFSTIAGSHRKKAFIKGTAPDASFVLLRSENAHVYDHKSDIETWFEEEAWISAIEYADSIGVDVVNSSLGYSTFNDEAQDHNYCQMFDELLRITRAANLAVDKGMAVIISAGNERTEPWKYICMPANAKNVLTVAAVNVYGKPTSFSGLGHKEHHKPDIAALGEYVPTVEMNDTKVYLSGTSFSSPLVAGAVACLWQCFPQYSPDIIFDAIRKSSSKYDSPNELVGFGLPDFKKAYNILSALD